MPALRRRRSHDPHRETWNVSYGDVVVGHIGLPGGVFEDRAVVGLRSDNGDKLQIEIAT